MEYYVVKYTALLVFGYMQTVYIHNKSLEYPPFKYIYIYIYGVVYEIALF